MKKNYIALLVSFFCALPAPLLSQAFVIGSATGSNSSGSYPAPFGRFYYGSRHQFVYTAAELQAAGLTSATVLDSVGFNVTAVNGADYHARFTIRVGNVAGANLASGWIDTTLLTKVYQNIAGVQPVLGWNMFKLNEPFLWDGTSDLVVETFHNDVVTYTQNASTQWTNTSLSITPTRYLVLDNESDDAFYTTSGSQTSNLRTDIRLVIAPPLLKAVPSAVNFNNVQVNTTSTPQTFTLKNRGNGSVFLNNIELIGADASEFLLSNLPSLPATLTTNATVTLDAKAAPTTLGIKSATVRLTYTTSESSTNATTLIQLTAQSVSGTPLFSAYPSSVNFGQCSKGGVTSARFITVKNLAGGGLVINGVTISGIDAARFGLVDANMYPKTLGINDSLRFSVTFSPIAAQPYSAAVNITHSGTVTETVSLSGTGIDAFIVSNNNDAGTGSLRQALEDVNGVGGSQTIQFNTTGTINLLSNLPMISVNVNIVGPGASQMTIRRDISAFNTRIFTIAPGATVSISGLSMSHGDEQIGAGILNNGHLTVTNCVISQNNAGNFSGGGIYNTGTLLLNNSTISNNMALQGGGIFNDGSMKLLNTVLNSNSTTMLGRNSERKIAQQLAEKQSKKSGQITASKDGIITGSGAILEGGGGFLGGGLFSNGANDTLINCQVIDNFAMTEGGGIYVAGQAFVKNSSIRLNSSDVGGGIFVGGKLILEESVVNSNYALSGGGIYISTSQDLAASRSVVSRNQADFSGGGIFIESGMANLVNSTVTANVSGAAGGGSGVHVSFPGVLNFENSVIYSNHQDQVNDVRDLSGSSTELNSLGYNVVGTLTAPSSIGGNVATNLTVHPQFVDSANGDYHLLPTSPAVDQGNPTVLPPLGGEPFVDIGAFETITNVVPTSNPNVGTTFTVLGGSSFALRAQGGTANVSAQQFFTLAPTITQGRAISRYWDINSNAPAFLRFYYRQSEVDNAGFTSNPVIYHFTGGTWVAVPTSAPTTLANGIRYVESTSPVTSFSPFTLGDPGDAPLPVELTSFRGTSSFGKVTLTWRTISEVDNQGFIVMRDGTQIASFETNPELIGQGTSTEAKDYTFNDVAVEVGKTYTYTLRSRDFNGTVHDYPDRVSVKVEAGATVVYDYRLAQNYPNPFNPTTTIEYGLKTRGLVTIQLYDVLGRMVAMLVNEVKDAGNYAVTFNASALSSGVYFYRYTAGGKTFTKQMLLVK